MSAASRSANQPDRMECHCMQPRLASPLGALQELDTEDFVHTMCNAQDEEEKRQSLHTDPATFQLNDQFVRAHGLPRGEYTIFTSAMDIRTTASTTLAKRGLR
jgi:hypothetical protein